MITPAEWVDEMKLADFLNEGPPNWQTLQQARIRADEFDDLQPIKVDFEAEHAKDPGLEDFIGTDTLEIFYVNLHGGGIKTVAVPYCSAQATDVEEQAAVWNGKLSTAEVKKRWIDAMRWMNS